MEALIAVQIVATGGGGVEGRLFKFIERIGPQRLHQLARQELHVFAFVSLRSPPSAVKDEADTANAA